MDDFFADSSAEIKHENHVNHDHQQPVIMQYQYPINQPMDGFLETRNRFSKFHKFSKIIFYEKIVKDGQKTAFLIRHKS